MTVGQKGYCRLLDHTGHAVVTTSAIAVEASKQKSWHNTNLLN